MSLKNIHLDGNRLRSLDSHDLLGKTLELPAQIEAGMGLGREFAKQNRLERISELDWIGLGGSAVAGDLLQAFGYEPPALPLHIHVQRFPVYAAPHRLLCSYSGNTAETVHAFEQSRREQIWFSMSSGGRLSELATKRGTPHVTLPGGYPPRAAVGFSLGVLKAIFEAVYGVAPHSEWSQAQNELIEDSETYRTLDAETNPALKLAVSLVDRTPVIYTLDGQTMPAVAARFHAQLAENSKVWSHSAELPEMAHNEVESFEFLAQVLPPPKVIFLGSWHLGSTFPDPRPGLRSLLDSMGIAHATLDPRELWPSSEGRLASGLRMMLLLDAASIYLALARAIDPFEIPAITRLKKTTLGA